MHAEDHPLMPRAFTAASSKLAFDPSPQQLAIFGWAKQGPDAGHLVVDATAGSGKTTTALAMLAYMPEQSILYCAFGKAIQETLDRRITNANAVAKTFHSLGNTAVRQKWGYRGRMETRKGDRKFQLAKEVVGGFGKATERLMAEATVKARELCPMATQRGDIMEMLADMDLLPDWTMPIQPEEFADMVLRTLDSAAKSAPMGIDYSDMIFLPLRNGWLQPSYEAVIVDEYQDLTMSQLDMARQVVMPGGRICMIGDKRQAIFSFRGVNAESIEQLKQSLHAKELPLSVTYRCPTKVVELANRYAPEMEAREGAPAGTIEEVFDLDDLIERLQPGDFVLSRVNAPLMPLVLKLLRNGKPARMQGRDVGKSLQSTVRRIARGDDRMRTFAFLDDLRKFEADQLEKLRRMDREDQMERVVDLVRTIEAIALDTSHVYEILHRIESLFQDRSPNAQVVCSSVHKAKGLEAQRVFILRGTLRSRPKCKNCRHFHGANTCTKCGCYKFAPDRRAEQEEKNIQFVALTRTKEHLVWVGEAGR